MFELFIVWGRDVFHQISLWVKTPLLRVDKIRERNPLPFALLCLRKNSRMASPTVMINPSRYAKNGQAVHALAQYANIALLQSRHVNNF